MPPEPVIITNEAGHIDLVNARAEAVFGHQRAEMVGQTIEFLLPESFRERHKERRRAFLRSRSYRPMEQSPNNLVARHKNGRTFPVEIGLSVVHTQQGIWGIAHVVDIKKHKQAEETLRKANKVFSPSGYDGWLDPGRQSPPF
jgi:PAS domain S-box-containing protein